MSHIHEKIDFCAEALVVCDGKVLLRRHEKYDVWLGAGGHIELYEDPNEAVMREVKEEVGLDIKLISPHPIPPSTPERPILIPPFFLDRDRIDETHEHVTMIYVATSENTNTTLELPTDVVRWVDREELEQMKSELIPSRYFYARAALDFCEAKE